MREKLDTMLPNCRDVGSLDATDAAGRGVKRARNRQHARESRERKKMQLGHLAEVEEENRRLRSAIDRMRWQIMMLQQYACILPTPSDTAHMILPPVLLDDLEFK